MSSPDILSEHVIYINETKTKKHKNKKKKKKPSQAVSFKEGSFSEFDSSDLNNVELGNLMNDKEVYCLNL